MIHRKVAAGGIGGASSVIAMWALGQFGEIVPPPEVASAVTTLLSAVVAWFTPSK